MPREVTRLLPLLSIENKQGKPIDHWMQVSSSPAARTWPREPPESTSLATAMLLRR